MEEDYKTKIPRPTKEDIKKATTEFREQHGKALTKEDAKKYAELRKELESWLAFEKELEKEDSITIDDVKATKDLYKKELGKDITLEQAHKETKKAYYLTIAKNRLRIDSELREIIEKYK